jgi:hypothetical protein
VAQIPGQDWQEVVQILEQDWQEVAQILGQDWQEVTQILGQDWQEAAWILGQLVSDFLITKKKKLSQLLFLPSLPIRQVLKGWRVPLG